MQIEKITKTEYPIVRKILKDLDLALNTGYQEIKDFVVAKKNQEIIGIAELREYPHFFLLNSFGIRSGYQNRKFGKTFLINLVENLTKPIYLYTIVPHFFQKVGFKITDFLPQDLPKQEMYQCHQCEPENCFLLVKTNDTSLS